MARKKEVIELTSEERLAIIQYLTLRDKYEKSYFWDASGTKAAERRKKENENYLDFENERLHVHFELRISSRRYYVSKYIRFDSIFHNARFLRNLI